MHRRTFVVTAGTATAASLAGCLHGGGGNQGSPEAVVKAALTAESADDVNNLVHPDSNFNTTESDFENSGDIEVLSTEVIAEDVNGSYFSDGNLSLATSSPEDIDSVADGDKVAVVEATFETTTNESTRENTAMFVTATDSGDWYLFDFAFELSV